MDEADDPELDRILAKLPQWVEPTQADIDAFAARLDRSLVDAAAGRLVDAEVVFDQLLRRYAEWPRAAE